MFELFGGETGAEIGGAKISTTDPPKIWVERSSENKWERNFEPDPERDRGNSIHFQIRNYSSSQ